jgi:hypothetical protein
MKKKIHSISKPKAALMLGLIIVALSGTFVCANIIINKKHQVANLTDVLGSSSNSYYDVKVLGHQTNASSGADGTAFTRVTTQMGVTNKTNTTLQIAPGLQVFLTSNTGTIYPITARYLTPGVVLGGELAANSYMLLNLDFDIPQAEQPSTITFQLDLSKPTVTIKL